MSSHVIRVWEKRYGAVRPARAANNRRLYTEKDVERLKLLRQAADAGHSISQIATAPISELERLLGESWRGLRPGQSRGELEERELIAAALMSVADMNTLRFQDVLDRAAIELGTPAVLTKFVAPLAREMGTRWRGGEVRVAQEHFATNLLKVFLNVFARPFAINEHSPHLLLATPSGQHHELGAMLAGAAARSVGWLVTYLGPSLPAEELLRADRAIEPTALGLSLVFPPNDKSLRADLRKLDRWLPRHRVCLLGGEAAPDYGAEFSRHRPLVIPELEGIFPALDRLAQPAAPKRSNKWS